MAASVTNHYISTELIVKTTHGDEYRGELFCYDIADSNSFILRDRCSKEGRVNYHWLKCSIVKDLEAVVPGESEEAKAPSSLDIDSLPYLPPISISKLESIDRQVEAQYANYKQTIGVGVTSEAQEIFDSLSKTMPCTWVGPKIQCYRVTIAAPYTPECAEGPDGNEVVRVKKVLEGERLRLEKRKQTTTK